MDVVDGECQIDPTDSQFSKMKRTHVFPRKALELQTRFYMQSIYLT